MIETQDTKSRMRILRRFLIGVAILATLAAIFYTEENWRGKRAWEHCKREQEARGVVMDWNKLIPPPVPDDQNFFKAPKMAEWFIRKTNGSAGALTNELSNLATNASTVAVITNQMVADSYLAWSDQFEPQFDLIREALKRPYAQMDGDYSQPFAIPIPTYITTRSLAQVLAQRTKCYLLLGQPEKALREVTLLNDLRHLLDAAPAGKPMTLVAAMINVAITGLYVGTVAEGLNSHAWREPQLVALQSQLAKVNLTSVVAEAFNMELVASCTTFETATAADAARWFPSGKGSPGFWSDVRNPMYLFFKFAPRGWVYQNMVFMAGLRQGREKGFDLANNLILPHQWNAYADGFMKQAGHLSYVGTPLKILAAIALPNFLKATETLAYNQTFANEAQVVCALERFHLAHGEYPETLDALMPQFIEKIPHDIIGGQPLHYRRTDGGKFLLYSVGWNETDDGGVVAKDKSGNDDRTQGDWVWQYPGK